MKEPPKMSTYKSEVVHSTFSAVDDAINALLELGSELQEIVDNASGSNLEGTERIQTLTNTAETLTNLNEVSIEDWMSDLPITYTESVQTRKGRSESRLVQCDNYLSVLRAVISAGEDLIGSDEYDADHEEELQTFIDELQSIVDECEGLEFPGMFG